MTFFLLALLGGFVAFGLGQRLPEEVPPSRFSPEGYKAARWLELHYGGPKAVRWPPPSAYLKPFVQVSKKPHHTLHRDPYTGEVTVEFR